MSWAAFALVRTGFALGPRWVLVGQHRVRHENFNDDFHSYEKFAAKKFQPIGVVKGGSGGRGEWQISRTDIYENIRTASDAGK